ncbi:MAG TPA: GntR family transcriptional regulator [Dictyobacter sp.]|nr:GntR family transcriptional regulator [Dictyobacter sp.]
MLLVLEIESEKPLYQQIRDQIVEGIAAGRLVPNQTLPSIRQLAADFGINLHTVNKAYDQLEREGFILLRRKTGAVIQINPRLAEDWEARMRTLLAEAFAKGAAVEHIMQQCQNILTGFQEQRNANVSLTDEGTNQ